MMKKTLWSALLLLAACGPAPDPADSPRVISPLTLEPPPIYALLGYRQQLSLESSQVATLDSIAEGVRRDNAPLIDSLQAVGRARGGRYSGMLAVDDQTQPVLDRIRENHQRAVDRVREVLTPEQQATTCRLFNESRQRTADEAQRRRPGPRAGIAPDSVAGGMSGRVWSWCTATPPPGA
jgi:hypothetical protein